MSQKAFQIFFYLLIKERMADIVFICAYFQKRFY